MKSITTSAALIALAMLGAACSNESSTRKAPEKHAAVSVYSGGPIYTGVQAAPRAEAIAVTDGKILAVGTRDLVISSAGANAKLINLDGAALYPGFTDSHAHLLGIGMRELTLNLEDISSIEELVSAVAANAQHTGENETIVGRGWIETGWPEGRMPNRDDLDPVSSDQPVILIRADGHALVANSAALNAVNVDDETNDPEGGKIERDENGRATGILIDRAMSLVSPLMAEPSEDKKRTAYEEASNVYAAYGWTGMHNMSVSSGNLDLIEELSDANILKIRSYNSIDPSGLDELARNGARKNKNNRVITRAVKLYADGALGSRGAALSEPYHDRPDTSGLLLLTDEDATQRLDTAIATNIQVNTHAIGDRGNKHVLDWYESAFNRHQNTDDLRWRVEHAQILHLEDIPRFSSLGVIPSMQPSHAIGDLFFAPARLGPSRLDGAYAWRKLIDSGAIIAAGSDAPVERGDPMIEFYAAVARRGLDGTQTEDWRPDQAVTREEALRMFTLWPAYASFQEDTLGTIEPGKKADFTVLSKDIMTIPEDEILTTKAVMTVVDGEIIYQAAK